MSSRPRRYVLVDPAFCLIRIPAQSLHADIVRESGQHVAILHASISQGLALLDGLLAKADRYVARQLRLGLQIVHGVGEVDGQRLLLLAHLLMKMFMVAMARSTKAEGGG